MRIRWIEALYGFSLDQTHVAVTANARGPLLKMADELVGTDNLVAIYVPEGTEDVYEPGNMRGRIVGAVRLLEMPAGSGIEDYPIPDWDQHEGVPGWDGSIRWPLGWPCAAVLAPDPAKCQTLRTLVSTVHPGKPFGDYALQFQHGPFRLGFEMQRTVNSEMRRLFGDPPWPDGSEC
jgi:hypothetical protein